jgi:hypothetical protein
MIERVWKYTHTQYRMLFWSSILFVLNCVSFGGPLLSTAAGQGRVYSKLWGQLGERWSPGGRLPDFSYAGYHRGETPIPHHKTELNVKKFGAVGDGNTDDTKAFQKAIDAAAFKGLFIPKGRYKITDFLTVSQSNVVIRGAGAESTQLFFPISLNKVKPNWGATTTGKRTSNYAWSGGFLRIQGQAAGELLAKVVAPAKRGRRTLAVSSTKALRVGNEVRLTMADQPDNSLARLLYNNDPGPLTNLKGRTRESFLFRIISVDSKNNEIEIDRPLRVDVRLEWTPQLFPAACSVQEVGIESLGFEFPVTPYGGHFTEAGYNAIAISGARNCWLKNITISNCDSGIFVSAANVSMQSIILESSRRNEASRKATGHHGITFRGQDNLLSDFTYRTRFMHGITMTRGSAGNVVMNGRGVDLSFDHHRYAPHSNLFTQIDLGLGTRMFQSGGGAKLGRHSGAYETFWNIRAKQHQTWPDGWGPNLMNLVGIHADPASATSDQGRWFEATSPELLFPPNLYEAQLHRRLSQ